ncbi:MAG: Ig-like domain-containing protein [Telluria sp.]
MSTPAFVEQLYLSFFGRAADAAGRAYWSQALDAGVMSAAEMTRLFLDSAEFAAAVEPVARLYYSAFDRIPDAAGLGFWLHSARAGMPLQALADAFAATPEFADLYGAARNPEFIDLIYQNALGRAPDAAGKAHWVEQLASGAVSRAGVLANLASSPELAAASSAAIKIIAQYHGITGSAPTPQQLASALALDQPLTLINQLFASTSYTGVQVPHPFVTDVVTTAQGGGAGEGISHVSAPLLDLDATTPADDATIGVSVTPRIVLAFSQDVHAGASGGMIYITDGAAQTVIDRATGLPRTRIVGATDTRAIDVNDAAHVSFDGGKVTVTIASALKPGISYSVLIGKGVLAGDNGLAFGGIAHTGTLNFTPSGDITPPEVVSFALDRTVLKSGNTSTVTITFSEAVESLDASAFEAPNGALDGFITENGGRTWQAVFTPANLPVDVGTNQLVLKANSVRDLAGNANTGTAVSNNYAVDTVVQPNVESKLEFNDTGILDDDLVTNDPTQTLSGKYVGAPSGTTLKVVVNGDSYAVPPNDGSNTWTFDGGVFIEGLNSVVVYFTNPAGKRSAERTLSFTLDTVAPTVTGGLAANVDANAPLVLSFSEAVYWNDEQAQLVFENAGGDVTVDRGDIQFSADRKSVTVGAANLLQAGSAYTLRLPEALTDAAGNAATSGIAFSTGGALPAPAAAVTGIVLSNVTGPLDSPYPITRIGTQNLSGTFTGTLGAGDKLMVWLEPDRAVQATVNGNGTWMLEGAQLEAGHKEIRAAVVNHAGDAGASYSFDYELDTEALAPAAPALLAAFDTGAFNDDGITAGLLPQFSGLAEAFATIKLYDVATNTVLGSDVADDSGAWTIGLASLPEGALRLGLTQSDLAGNASAMSPELAVRVDRTAPVAPAVPNLLDASDTGASPIDNITRDTRPLFGGDAGTAGDYVRLYANGVEVGTSQVAANGTWQVAPASALANGAHEMTVRFVDAAGNAGAASSALGVTIDTIAPTVVSTTPGNMGFLTDYVRVRFSENIKFTPSGQLEIKSTEGILAHLFNILHNVAWNIGGTAAGNDLAVLGIVPDVGAGTYTLKIDTDTIHDLAGNAFVPVVGVPVLTFQA